MALPLLETDNLSNQDITSLLEVGSFTAVRDCRISAAVLIKDLANSAALFDFVVKITRGAATYVVQYQKAIGKYLDADTTFGWISEQIGCALGDVITVSVLSSNAGDNANVDIITEFYDCSYSTISNTASDAAGFINLSNLTIDATGTGLSALDITGDPAGFSGVQISGGIDSPGVEIYGGTGAFGAAALTLIGSGSGSGLSIEGGDTGSGVTISAGATGPAAGMTITGSGSADGVTITTGSGVGNITALAGLRIVNNFTTNGNAVLLVPKGSGSGILNNSGNFGLFMNGGTAGIACGVTGSGLSTGTGFLATGGPSGYGMRLTKQNGASGGGLDITAANNTTNGSAITLTAKGTGAGITASGGDNGVSLAGAANGIYAIGFGSNTYGIYAVGDSAGINATSFNGAGIRADSYSGSAISATSVSGYGLSILSGGGGVDITASGTGVGITSLAGSGGSAVVLTGDGAGDGMRLVGGVSGASLNAGGDVDPATVAQLQSALALETTVQDIKAVTDDITINSSGEVVVDLDGIATTADVTQAVTDLETYGGAAPWTTADVSALALEATSQAIKAVTDDITINSSGEVVVDLDGVATATDVTQAVADIEAYGGTGPWTTATGFATPTDVTDAVSDIETYGGTGPWTTATGFATPGDVIQAVADIEAYGGTGPWGDGSNGFTQADRDLLNKIEEITEGQ